MTNPHLHLSQPNDLQDPDRDIKDATAIFVLIDGIEQSIQRLVNTGLFTRAEAENQAKVFRTRGLVEILWENPRKRHTDTSLRMNKVHDHGGLWTQAAVDLSNQDRSLWSGNLRFEHVVPAKVIATGINDIIHSDLTEDQKIATVVHLLRTLPHHCTLTRTEDLMLPPNMAKEDADNLLRTVLGDLHPEGDTLDPIAYQQAVWSRYPQSIIDSFVPFRQVTN